MRPIRRLALALLILATAGLGACGDDNGFTDDDDDDSTNDGGATDGRPHIEALSPARGPLRGGTEVTLTGSGFVLNNAGMNNVVIGGVLADDVTTIDDTTVLAVVPAGVEPGAVDVVLFNANGFSNAEGSYSYNALPTITAVDPDRGDRLGGTTVTITGTGFEDLDAGDATVRFGTEEGSEVVVVSDTELTVTTPPGPIFTLVDVALENTNGAASRSSSYGYDGHGLLIAGMDRDFAGSTLSFVDPANGERIPLFDVEIDGESIGLSGMTRSGGVLYGTAGNRNQQTFLVSLDLFARETTVIGALLGGGASAGSGGGGLYCHDLTTIGTTVYCVPRYNGNDVYSLNLDSAEVTIAQPGTSLGDKPVVATNGATTYLLSQVCGKGCFTELRSVAADWSTSFIATVNIESGRPNELHYFDGALYMMIREGGGKGSPAEMAIYQVDPVTGGTTLVTQFEGYHHAMGATE
jgi:hypothetical protein